MGLQNVTAENFASSNRTVIWPLSLRIPSWLRPTVRPSVDVEHRILLLCWRCIKNRKEAETLRLSTMIRMECAFDSELRFHVTPLEHDEDVERQGSTRLNTRQNQPRALAQEQRCKHSPKSIYALPSDTLTEIVTCKVACTRLRIGSLLSFVEIT